MRDDPYQLQELVERQFCVSAGLRRTSNVELKTRGEPRRDRTVCIFDIKGHPLATTAYAWVHDFDDAGEPIRFAMLQHGIIASPEDAVRAAINNNACGA